jgi:hypothetical protein
MPSIDTHALIEELIASGVKKKQSEIIIKVISQEADRLVPKTDLELALSDIRSDMKWLKSLIFLILGLVISLWFK